ncbi:amino acid transporter [Cellulomonas sp. ACRRI]|uniref:nucleotidyltransferase domain-containing protein n=1 Tax=Cellulomonas sp. ACRRI TaxID=2918188 RepID=UPI001EF3470E|nr:amino acid transporter [Cellulomonas sp. ACRRI]MCG7284607.1 amino acid transporter [Cellulomonas sp. ACRRI]
MDPAEVHRVLDALATAGCRSWVAGGWGVDALVGRQTRAHRDLDLALDAAGEAAAVGALAVLDYAVETDWRPVRVELAAPGGRWVDLHPVAFDARGRGTQAGLDGVTFDYPPGCFVTGTIDGRLVGCLSAAQQVAFHTGYPPRAVDLADLALLGRLGAGGPGG